MLRLSNQCHSCVHAVSLAPVTPYSLTRSLADVFSYKLGCAYTPTFTVKVDPSRVKKSGQSQLRLRHSRPKILTVRKGSVVSRTKRTTESSVGVCVCPGKRNSTPTRRLANMDTHRCTPEVSCCRHNLG